MHHAEGKVIEARTVSRCYIRRTNQLPFISEAIACMESFVILRFMVYSEWQCASSKRVSQDSRALCKRRVFDR